MPSQLALLVCLCFVAYLFRSELKRSDRGSAALWIPLAWMFLAGSRWVSSWLNLNVPLASADDYAEGSPVDRAAFLALIVMGAIVLANRRIRWDALLIDNKWLVLYLGYCLASIAWTDQPVVLFKRWIKDLGNPIMVMVMLSSPRPYDALGTVLRRLSYLLLPTSVLFIRFFPALGRTYRPDGSPMYTGVGHQKNDLGLMCLVTGVYFAWQLFIRRNAENKAWGGIGPNGWILVSMLVYLLYMSNSQTALVCLVAATLIVLAKRFGPFARGSRAFVPFVVFSTMALLVFDLTFGLREQIFALLGRNPTLTNRTELWALLRSMVVNPLIGAGFMSFWSGDRLEEIWRQLGEGINQAHSGYLEQYLNLGYIGLGFIAVITLSALFSIQRQFRRDHAGATLRFCFLACGLIYNYTEASFYGMNNMWILFLVGCIDITRQPNFVAAMAPSTAGNAGEATSTPRSGSDANRSGGVAWRR